MINLADDAHMRGLEALAEEFYENILRPDEEPGFVSDDASLLDISLAPEEPLISRIKTHYSKTVTELRLARVASGSPHSDVALKSGHFRIAHNTPLSASDETCSIEAAGPDHRASVALQRTCLVVLLECR